VPSRQRLAGQVRSESASSKLEAKFQNITFSKPSQFASNESMTNNVEDFLPDIDSDRG
jgi:hypothetical protein